MQSTIFVAGMDTSTDPRQKHFDTSGKSPAQLHHPAICKNADDPSSALPKPEICRQKRTRHPFQILTRTRVRQTPCFRG
jgi:hypothetical protein